MTISKALREHLTAAGKLREGRELTHAVVLYRIVETDGAGRRIARRGRCYPMGALDPTLERGMLDDALWDARHDRRCACP